MTTNASLFWSTADVDANVALSHWRSVLENSLVELEVDSHAPNFYAELRQAKLGPSLFSEMRTGPQVSKRTRAAISKSHWTPAFGLIQSRIGTMQYRQGKCEGVLNPGDCVLLDRTEPYRITTDGTNCIILGMSADWLSTWIAEPERLAGQHLNGKQGWGQVLSAMLWQLNADEFDDLALPLSTVAEQIAGALVLTAGLDRQPSSRHSHKLFERASKRLREMAFDANVSPAGLANDLRISKRYLHHLFAQEGTTFGRELAEIRLLKAHQLLADRRFAKIPIGEVAFRCGFADQSHFSKRFSQRFGTSPIAFRKQN